jgi:hypothetical protein
MSVDFGIGGGQGTSPLRYQGMTVLLEYYYKSECSHFSGKKV